MRVYVLLHKPPYLADADEPNVVDAIDEHSLDAGCLWDGDLDEAGKIEEHGEGEFRTAVMTVSGDLLNSMFKALHAPAQGVTLHE